MTVAVSNQGLAALLRKPTKTAGMFRVGADADVNHLPVGSIVTTVEPTGATRNVQIIARNASGTYQGQYLDTNAQFELAPQAIKSVTFTPPATPTMPAMPAIPASTPSTSLTKMGGGGAEILGGLLVTASMAASAYHGYKRNSSVGWAIWWGLMGTLFPVITPVIAVAEGFGKPKK